MSDSGTSSRKAAHESDVSRFTPAPKSRSCVVCRSRKVRCDKSNPCSNCRKANIACVFPASDRPPKWVRRLERITKETGVNQEARQIEKENVDQVMQRLRSLEGLVKELSGQLENANSASSSTVGGISNKQSPAGSGSGHDGPSRPGIVASDQNHFGRLVVHDKDRSRYVSSGFWSRMNDELEGLKMATQDMTDHDSDDSVQDHHSTRTTTMQEISRTPSERHSFFFRHNLGMSPADSKEFHPLPSQIPFLLDTYTENVNFVIGILHMPTVRHLVRSVRGSDTPGLSPANEALLFSIYYAAVTSMEDDDVINNFGTTKAELNLKFRLGLEYALAKADFLNIPDLSLVQAFTNFLCLARRHDSPRFIWMMTGLLIRMGQSLGLQRDGSNFSDLTPFEVEMRRRLWWTICLLDIRASEDQGTEITITRDSFDTQLPSNVRDIDIGPDRKDPPVIQEGLTEVTAALVSNELTQLVREMVAPGGRTGIPSVETQSKLIDKLNEKANKAHLKLVDQASYWMAYTASLLVMSKMRLLIYLPVLFTSSSEGFSDEIRNKLLVAAIEVAEWNHALNANESVRQWRWIYQTYTHWYSIVYMLLEIARRPLLPIVERAWVALQSKWLIPPQSQLDSQNRHWIPLRKLMARARSHRDEELQRLKRDPQYLRALELENKTMPSPGSSGPFTGEDSADLFLTHWRDLIASSNLSMQSNLSRTGQPPNESHVSVFIERPGTTVITPSGSNCNMYGSPTNPPPHDTSHQSMNVPDVPFSMIPIDWTAGQDLSAATPWLWSEGDLSFDDMNNYEINMDSEGDMNWQNWLEAAKDLG